MELALDEKTLEFEDVQKIILESLCLEDSGDEIKITKDTKLFEIANADQYDLLDLCVLLEIPYMEFGSGGSLNDHYRETMMLISEQAGNKRDSAVALSNLRNTQQLTKQIDAGVLFYMAKYHQEKRQGLR